MIQLLKLNVTKAIAICSQNIQLVYKGRDWKTVIILRTHKLPLQFSSLLKVSLLKAETGKEGSRHEKNKILIFQVLITLLWST